MRPGEDQDPDDRQAARFLVLSLITILLLVIVVFISWGFTP